MTEYAYEYGRRWNVKTPRYTIGIIVDSYHVLDSDVSIINEIERRIAVAKQLNPGEYTDSICKQCVTYALMRHARNRKLFVKVSKGI